jgi:hypothetical protein
MELILVPNSFTLSAPFLILHSNVNKVCFERGGKSIYHSGLTRVGSGMMVVKAIKALGTSCL